MFQNLHISVNEVVPEVGPVIEPVSLDEAKAWMQIDFADHDDVITALIVAARQMVESYTSISLVEKTVVLSADVTGSTITELPHGPVRSITSLVGLNEGDYEHLGQLPDTEPITGYWRYKWLNSAPVVITYTAGYEAGKVPQALKQAIMVEVDYRFHNRGSNEADFTFANRGGIGICQGSQALAHPYIKMWI